MLTKNLCVCKQYHLNVHRRRTIGSEYGHYKSTSQSKNLWKILYNYHPVPLFTEYTSLCTGCGEDREIGKSLILKNYFTGYSV